MFLPRFLLLVLCCGLLFLPVSGQEPRAQLLNPRASWVAEQLDGIWTLARLGAVWGEFPSEKQYLRLRHGGSGVFFVETSSQAPPLSTWNGQQMLLKGIIETDEEGWNSFSFNDQDCRLGRDQQGRIFLVLEEENVPEKLVAFVKEP